MGLEIKKKSKVSSSNGIIFTTIIPKIIVELAGITKGQKLLWRYDGNKIVIELLQDSKQD